jgi:hypothetical protein
VAQSTLAVSFISTILSRSSIRIAHRDFFRLPTILTGKDGEDLKRKVWSKIVEALKKDVPGLTDIITRLEAFCSRD